MNNAHTKIKIAALAVAVLAAGFTAAWAAPLAGEGDNEHQIRIEKKVRCEGEDCAEEAGGHKVIFIDEDGNEKVIEGVNEWVGDDGHAMKWLAGDGVKMMVHGPGQEGGFLGVGLTELTPELRTHFGVPENAGVMVSKVVDDSAAQKAGIQVGDIITLVDSKEVASGGALSHAIGSHEGGESVTLEIWRNGGVQQLTATLGERQDAHMAMMPRMHMGHGGDGEHAMKRHIEIHCEDGDENCGAGAGGYDCGGAEECEVSVQCTEGGCECTVNGEDADCADIPGVPHQ